MAALTRVFDGMHGLLHRHRSTENEQSVQGMTQRESTAREIAESQPLLLAQVVGYTGF